MKPFIVTVTRDAPTDPAALKVYANGALAVAVPLSRQEVIHMIRQLAEVVE